MRDTSRESMCISKIKKMLAIALSVSMLLSACGSTSTENTAEDQPVEQTMEEPNDTSSIDQEQAENATEKTEQNSSAADETIEMYIPGIFAVQLTNSFFEQIPDNVQAVKNSDASWTLTVSPDVPDDMSNKLLDAYKSLLAQNTDTPIKSVSWNDDFSEVTFSVDPSGDYTSAVTDDLLQIYGAFAIHHEPEFKLNVNIVNNQDQTSLATFSYPTEQADFKGVNLGNIDVFIGDSYIRQSYDGSNCLTVYFLFVNNSKENQSFSTAVLDQAFQNGVQLDSTISATEDSNADPFKSVQPGYSMVVERSYTLPNTSDPVTVEVSGFLSDSPNKASKTFSLTQE